MYLGLELHPTQPGRPTIYKCGLTRSKYRRKRAKILGWILNGDYGDLNKIRRMGIRPGGLLCNELRVYLWPKLLRVPFAFVPTISVEEARHSPTFAQVEMDVHRTVGRFPPGTNSAGREVLKERLLKVIMTVLSRNPDLHYYQGFNDVCLTFLLVGGEGFAVALVEQMTKEHLSIFMETTMESAFLRLKLLLALVGLYDMKLLNHLNAGGLSPDFAVSWVLTWFSHAVADFGVVLRIYDHFISCSDDKIHMPLYLAAAIVIYRTKDIMETEPEMGALHQLLLNLPQDLPWDYLLKWALKARLKFSPARLQIRADWSRDRSSSGEEARSLPSAATNSVSARQLATLPLVNSDIEPVPSEVSSVHAEVGSASSDLSSESSVIAMDPSVNTKASLNFVFPSSDVSSATSESALSPLSIGRPPLSIQLSHFDSKPSPTSIATARLDIRPQSRTTRDFRSLNQDPGFLLMYASLMERDSVPLDQQDLSKLIKDDWPLILASLSSDEESRTSEESFGSSGEDGAMTRMTSTMPTSMLTFARNLRRFTLAFAVFTAIVAYVFGEWW